MTPAVEVLKRNGIAYSVHEYEPGGGGRGYGLEAAAKLNLDPLRVFKTLVVQFDSKQLAVAVVPVAGQLNLKRLARALGVKKVAMADKDTVGRITGYVLGGVSPLGQRKTLPTVIDESALDHASIFVSGGRRGLDIELAPADLVKLTAASLAAIT